MGRFLSVIVSFVSVMTFAQEQSAEPAPQDSAEFTAPTAMLQIGKSYLGTKYVANTLDRRRETGRPNGCCRLPYFRRIYVGAGSQSIFYRESAKDTVSGRYY